MWREHALPRHIGVAQEAARRRRPAPAVTCLRDAAFGLAATRSGHFFAPVQASVAQIKLAHRWLSGLKTMSAGKMFLFVIFREYWGRILVA